MPVAQQAGRRIAAPVLEGRELHGDEGKALQIGGDLVWRLVSRQSQADAAVALQQRIPLPAPAGQADQNSFCRWQIRVVVDRDPVVGHNGILFNQCHKAPP